MSWSGQRASRSHSGEEAQGGDKLNNPMNPGRLRGTGEAPQVSRRKQAARFIPNDRKWELTGENE
jgi:hypothetical protein